MRLCPDCIEEMHIEKRRYATFTKRKAKYCVCPKCGYNELKNEYEDVN